MPSMGLLPNEETDRGWWDRPIHHSGSAGKQRAEQHHGIPSWQKTNKWKTINNIPCVTLISNSCCLVYYLAKLTRITMSSNSLDIAAPRVAPLPDGPKEGPFSDLNWSTLMAIMDTIIPSIRRETTTSNKISQLTISEVEYNTTTNHLKELLLENAPASESLDEYFDEKPSDIPQFQDLLKRSLVFFARDDAKKGLTLVLSTLK